MAFLQLKKEPHKDKPINIKFVKFHEFTSTYYFISRIINALWAKNEKEKIFNKSINN